MLRGGNRKHQRFNPQLTTFVVGSSEPQDPLVTGLVSFGYLLLQIRLSAVYRM